MTRELESKHTVGFPPAAPAANPVFFRTYSRRTGEGRESWEQVCDRTIEGLVNLGKLTPQEQELLERTMRSLKSLPSGRWLWVGGTEWLEAQKNFSGAYNCTSTNVVDWRAFGLMMDLAMMGCGTGAVLETPYINQLPPIRNRLNVKLIGEIGSVSPQARREQTEVKVESAGCVQISVGDSRNGWIQSYQALLELSSDGQFAKEVEVKVDPSHVRPAGELLKGFGGVANPIKFPDLFPRIAKILNRAVGRQLNPEECCLLIDEAAASVVAGNIRRCLPEDALVHTSEGLIPIKEIQVGDLVQTPVGFRKVLDKFDQGDQEVHEIETNATLPRATLNHRQAVLADATGSVAWKQVSNLSEGDRLMHNTQVLPGIPTSLPDDFTEKRPARSRTAKSLVVPHLTPEIAWLIGFTHGDGYVSLGRNKHDKPYGYVYWATNALDEKISPQIQTKLDSALAKFGLRARHNQLNGENTILSVCSSIRLAEYFSKHIKQPHKPIAVPSFILQGMADVRAAYLAGLMDSDGAINNQPPHLVTTVYRSFARQVSSVLSSLGIAGRLKITLPKQQNWQPKYNLTIPALKDRYNDLIAPHAVKGKLHQGLKMYGFTIAGEMMREAYTYSEMREWGFQGFRFVDSNYERYVAESDVTLDIPVTVQGVGSCDYLKTYDIEVEEAHCFYCDGYLTHNSAGMRQFNADSPLLKQNLWQPDEEGNWRIDPERDALRMANHSRVYHHKPKLEECVDAVRSQYYSGEGAIQWAGEAVARANRDLLATPDMKAEFLKVYERGTAKQWLQKSYPNLDADELEHRLARYGLNPCLSADTWIHTEFGARQIKDLIGEQVSVYVNGELFSTTPEGFYQSGIKPIHQLTTTEGISLRLTDNHQLLKVTAQTQKKQYSEWVKLKNLKPGDKILIHNHRDLQPWYGEGTFEQGWLLGSFIGDGCYSINQTSYQRKAVLHYWGEYQQKTASHAASLIPTTLDKNDYMEVGGASLYELAHEFDLSHGNKTIKIEQASYDFYKGFLQGIFDANGSVQGNQIKGASVRLAHSNLELLQAVQRMLIRLGIVSVIDQNRRTEHDRFLPDGKGKTKSDHCQAQHELIVSRDNLYEFQALVNFQDESKRARLQKLLGDYQGQLNRERFTVTVAEIISDGVEPVYDCTVPQVSRFDANGIVAHNCGEIIGSNFHCVSGDTWLITRDGIHQIKDVVGQEVEVWNGNRWSQVTPFQTNTGQKLYRVWFGDGSYLDATEYHRFFVKDRFGKSYQEVQTKDLSNHSKYRIHTEPFTIEYEDGKEIDLNRAYTLGVAAGDGTLDQNGNAKVRLYSQKPELAVAGKKSSSRNYDYLFPLVDITELDFSGELLRRLKTEAEALNLIGSWNKQAILAFIAGLADTDGSNTSSNGIRIYVSDYERARCLQLLLCKCGIRCSVNLMAQRQSSTNLGKRSQDIYYLQINDCAGIPCQRLDTSKGHQPKFKGKEQIVQCVEELPGLHDTYCFNEPEFNKGVFGNTLTGNCNLSEVHLNQIDPQNDKEQEEAFTAGALSVAALLHHQFIEPRYQYSRELDPIVGVSFTGLFDFFVHAFGYPWLRWWEEGRPETSQGLAFKRQEQEYLSRWQEIVHRVIWEYCDRHGLKLPNRCTCVQPSGTKSLLTNASPGWHPPKAVRYIRRITFGKNDPVALACIDYGYNVIPSQSDKDENGNLLNDPFDERCTEWLVEIPVALPWADLPGADQIDINQFSAIAQMDFYLNVQRFWTTHNTSATIELRENEIEALGTRIYEAIRDDEGYISAALLARFDAHQSFPRLPFEPITQQQYEQLMQGVERRRKQSDFQTALSRYDAGEFAEAGPAGCDSDKCLFPEQ